MDKIVRVLPAVGPGAVVGERPLFGCASDRLRLDDHEIWAFSDF